LYFGFKLGDALLSSAKLERRLMRHPSSALGNFFGAGRRTPDCLEGCPSSAFYGIAATLRKREHV